MSRLTSAWDRSGNQLRQETRWREIGTEFGLFLAGMVLCFINFQFENYESVYLHIFPTFSSLHSLNTAIAALPFNVPLILVIINGVATALTVPLLYVLGKETFRLRLPALLSAVIYLNFLPIFSYGRTASLDGCILLLAIFLFTCGLRSRRDLRWSLGVGLSAGILILLNHWIGFLFIITLFAFLCWDTPRLITSGYFWLGSILGSTFPLAYYSYTITKLESLTSLLGIYPNFSYFSLSYCLKLIIFAFPWLIFIKDGWKLAEKEPQWSWAKFVRVWGGIMSLGALFTAFFAPFPLWLSIYPIFALLAGMTISNIYQWPSDRTYPLGWSGFFFSLAVITFIGGFGLYFKLFFFFPHLSEFAKNPDILLLTSALILTFLVSGILIMRRNQQFIAILAWGLYVSSLFWFNSLHSLFFSV